MINMEEFGNITGNGFCDEAILEVVESVVTLHHDKGPTQFGKKAIPHGDQDGCEFKYVFVFFITIRGCNELLRA